jgi:hypothetical protein
MTSVLELRFDGGVLRRLSVADARAYYEAVQRNRDHLTGIGDYLDEVAASVDEFRQRFGNEVACMTSMPAASQCLGSTSAIFNSPSSAELSLW